MSQANQHSGHQPPGQRLANGLRLIPVPALQDNYIWLLADDNDDAIAVDPGEAAPVQAVLQREGLRLTAILATHHHPDHIAGIAGLAADQDVSVHAPDDPRITPPFTCATPRAPVRIDAPALAFDVIAVPGHTSSHIAYHGHGLLFCGDTLFSVGCGRMFEGDAAQMLASLDRLASLPTDTLVCCGHEYTLANCAFAQGIEPRNAALDERATIARARRDKDLPTVPSRLSDELACNPFLRVDTPALAARFPEAGDRVERFAALRSSKDAYRPPAA